MGPILPNLSALRHRAPLASTGPPALDGEGAICPITLNELRKGDDVWQPELEGGTHRRPCAARSR